MEEERPVRVARAQAHTLRDVCGSKVPHWLWLVVWIVPLHDVLDEAVFKHGQILHVELEEKNENF